MLNSDVESVQIWSLGSFIIAIIQSFYVIFRSLYLYLVSMLKYERCNNSVNSVQNKNVLSAFQYTNQIPTAPLHLGSKGEIEQSLWSQFSLTKIARHSLIWKYISWGVKNLKTLEPCPHEPNSLSRFSRGRSAWNWWTTKRRYPRILCAMRTFLRDIVYDY